MARDYYDEKKKRNVYTPTQSGAKQEIGSSKGRSSSTKKANILKNLGISNNKGNANKGGSYYGGGYRQSIKSQTKSQKQTQTQKPSQNTAQQRQQRRLQNYERRSQRPRVASTSKEMIEQRQQQIRNTANARTKAYQEELKSRRPNLNEIRSNKNVSPELDAKRREIQQKANQRTQSAVTEQQKPRTPFLEQAQKNLKAHEEPADIKQIKQKVKSGIATTKDKEKLKAFNEEQYEKGSSAYRLLSDSAEVTEHTLKRILNEDKRMWNISKKGNTDMDAFLYTTPEQREEAEKKFKEREAKYSARIDEENAAIEELKGKHGYLGAQALDAVSSGVGMAVDAAFGPAALAHMWVRSTGGSLGQVNKKAAQLRKNLEASGNYTEAELDDMFKNVDQADMLNAMVNGGIEVLTEKMFAGIGLGKRVGGKGFGITQRAADRLFAKVGVKSTSGIAGQLLKGTAEEIAEEEIGNPLQTRAANLIYGNKFQEYSEEGTRRSLKSYSDDLRSQIESPEHAKAIAERLASSEYLKEGEESYKEAGFSDEEAKQLSELTRDYLTASLEGDTDAMESTREQMIDVMTSGERSMKESWTLQDAVDVAVSTAMMTAVSGAPGAVTTAQAGAEYKASFGNDGVKNLLSIVRDWDTEGSAKAQAMIDHLDSGKELSDTQVAMIVSQAGEIAQQNFNDERSKWQVAESRMKQNDLRIAPAMRNENGEIVLEENTRQRYDSIVNDTVSRYKSLSRIGRTEGIEDSDVGLGADIAAAYETGVISAEQINQLVKDENAGARAVFEDVTGVNLSQFEVRNNRGINLAATNNAIRKGLFAQAADNYVNSARLEQAIWNDEERGAMAQEMSRNVGGSGAIAALHALETVDPRDKHKFQLTGLAASAIYDYARNTEDSWETVKKKFGNRFEGVDDLALKYVYNAAKDDKAKAESKYYGKAVKARESMERSSLKDSTQAVAEGTFTNESARELKASEMATLTSVANQLGINVIMTDSLQANENGRYLYESRTIMLNSRNTMEENLEAIFSHEVTHHLAIYATDEYLKLSRYVMDRWFKSDAEEFNKEIKRIQDLYRSAKGQELSPEEALEELIADASYEFWSDEEFVQTITTEEPSLAKSIINAIKDFIQKLRSILASGNITDEETSDMLFSNIDAYDKAYKYWLDAYSAARSVQARQAIDDLQERIYAEEGDEARHSITPAQDAEYMKAVEAGDMQTAQRMVDEAAERAMPHTKLKGKWYHGTENNFTIFDFSQGGKNGHADGFGIYLTNDKEVASSYGNRMIEGYVNMERPASALTTATLKKDELHRLIKRTVDEEAETLLQDGYDSIDAARFDTWISNYTDTYYAGSIDKAIDEVIKSITDMNGNDYDIILEIMTGMGIRDYDAASSFYDILTEETGIDGYETKWGDESEMADPNTPTIALAFRSEQIKSADPVTYDDNGDVIPLSERFNQSSPDIRYSIGEEAREALNAEGIEELADGTTARYSLTSWQETNKEKKLKALTAANHDEKTAKKWIEDIDSIASIILGDPERLDYEADRSNKFLKPNGDYYKYTLDASTLCDKRRIYQGTYNAIQHAMPDIPLMQDDVVRIRTLLKEKDHKAPCGICYVESQRKNLGAYAKEWYDSYARKDEIRLEDVTTSDGLKELKKTNPEVAADFEKAMAAKGVSSPKVVKLRTDYREDIMRMRPSTIEYLNSIGGLRFHSFSDFETPHLIDTMQAVMDMATKNLMGMAYAKVPNFAAVFGPTGIKINLSLIAKTDENGNAVHDEDGRLVFDSVEGIPYEEAKKWRDAYPDNVAFILVGKDKEHTLEAINDDRVDFVIPFHRSKWSAEDMRRLGLVGYEDFATGHQENGIFVSEFWDYNKTGKENAERYLEVCKERGVTPIFEQLLHDNGDGTYSLQEDGSTDNYWKLLVEGKMYNHITKKGAPQQPVKPNFNMEEARRVLKEYEGGANELPVADDVVEAFVKEYKDAHPDAEIADARLSISADLDEPYMQAVNSGNMKEAQRLVDEAAKSAEYDISVFHGTTGIFDVFDRDRAGGSNGMSRLGFWFTETQEGAQAWAENSWWGDNNKPHTIGAYIKLKNPKIYETTKADETTDKRLVDLRERRRTLEAENQKLLDKYGRFGTVFDYTMKMQFNNAILRRSNGVVDRDRFDSEEGYQAVSKDIKAFRDTRDRIDAIQEEILKIEHADAYEQLKIDYYHAAGMKTEDALVGGLGMAIPNEREAVEKFREQLKAEGYDGIIIRNTRFDSSIFGGINTQYVVFEPEQVKSADPVTYAEDGSVIPLSQRFDPTNNDIRYSISTVDADGNVLTDGQMEYFKDSKARDEEGRLVPVYHTTLDGGFTVFDPSKSVDRVSLFFTSNFEVSQTYGHDANRAIDLESGERQNGFYSGYLNLKNPMIVEGNGMKWHGIRIGNVTHTTNEWAVIAKDEGYDGVIFRDIIDMGYYGDKDIRADIYVAFSSEQVKDIDNANPTEDPDIRYSITPEDEVIDYLMNQNADVNIDSIPLADTVAEEGRRRMAKSKAEFIQSKNLDWNERWLTHGKVLNTESVEKNIRNLIMAEMANSDTSYKYKQELVDEMVRLSKSAFLKMKQGRQTEAMNILWDAATKMIEEADFIDDTVFKQYKDLRDYLRTTSISLGEEYWSDVGYANFRRQNRGRIKLVKGDTNIDKIYGELQEKWGEWFDEEETSDAPAMLMRIAEVLDTIQPYKIAYTSEQARDLAADIADDLYNIIYEGESYKSIADTYKDKYDAKTKALKQRHREALREVNNEIKNLEEQLDKAQKNTEKQKETAKKWQDKYQGRVKKDKERRAEKKTKAEHRKAFESVLDDYNKLCKWVLEPTKDKNVPEEFRRSLAEFLQTMDLQTENSKKLEAKTGRTAIKTFNLRELKDRLNDLAARKGADGNGTSLFEVDGNVAFILEKLADKLEKNGNTIDALGVEDIKSIQVFMKLLIRNIERYKEVKLETKMMNLNAYSDECMDFFIEKIERDGKHKERGGLPGALEAINATALTPSYFFDRLGPMKEIYLALRHNGFDNYIRNEKEITDSLTDILGKFYKGGKKPRPGSDIEAWRDDRSAQTFNLSSGEVVTMSVAQMMSLYCLANRGVQALGHMLCGGIAVTPIQTGAKIEQFKERYKGKVQSTQRVVLEYDDILEIISKLTPEQKEVADKLQRLMSKDMAKLGNEAHRDLYGYDMFEEDLYFPIKVHGNARDTDINNIGEVVEKIKSFGFTKPLTPNANKAIEIDDIFSIVADHCNGMNLYNAYLVPITDFMKVLNYTRTDETGKPVSMKDLIEDAYGADALKYILNLMKDINGLKADNRGGLEGVMNKALGTAKKTAVFGNVRVALQQPTAIVRALAVLDPKYFKPFLDIKPNVLNAKERKAVYDEMFRYCPIAQWKSWGYYDTYMGRDIEDVMMNNWSRTDVALSGMYGALDNMTWSAIWQAVKAEQADLHPDMDENSAEFLEMCGRRASEVFDKTQVVDSTFHRSDAMRNKQIAVKAFTAFMAEPTLTLNVFRAGLYNFADAWRRGDKTKAIRILSRAIAIIIIQAAVVSAAQAFADAWRGKDPDWPWNDDDDEEKENGYWQRWMHNFVLNLFDQLHLENNMYLVKDVMPYINYMISKGADHWNWNPTLRAIMGWDQDYLYSQNNLIFAAIENTANGVAQVFKKMEKGEDYDKDWYDIIQKVSSGVGTFLGIPIGTLMRDTKPVWEKILGITFAADSELAEKTKTKKKKSDDDSGKKGKGDSGSGDAEEAEPVVRDETQMASERVEKAASLAEKYGDLSGSEKDKKIWSSVTTFAKDQTGSKGFKEIIADGDYASIAQYRDMYIEAGGSASYFDERVMDMTKTEFKKSLKYDQNVGERSNMKAMWRYMVKNGYSEEDISADILYKSDLAKDLKVAFRLGDEGIINEALVPLVDAGIVFNDIQRLYDNRNHMQLSSYNGRYKDLLKSTGNFIWPVNGTITSHFGYRDAPTAGASSNHPAIDIAAPTGTPVSAADGGVVIYAGSNGGYGNSVGIKHDNGMITYYNHLSGWSVKKGDTVAQGQEIGAVGSTGISTGPHLDFKVIDTNGKPVDPEQYLSKLG